MAKNAKKSEVELTETIGTEDLPTSNVNTEDQTGLPTPEQIAQINLPDLEEVEQYETVVSGASFKEFTDGEIFDCIYTGNKSVREQDVVDGKGNVIHKAGDTMGYLVVDRKTGEESILGNAWAVNKAFTEGNFKAGDKLRVIFLGKSENAVGQPLNLFKIQRVITKK